MGFVHGPTYTMTIGSQTARKGMRYFGLTYAKYAGKAPSRAQAHVSRDAEATEPRVADMRMHKPAASMAEAPPSEPVALRQSVISGYGDAESASMSPMV